MSRKRSILDALGIFAGVLLAAVSLAQYFFDFFIMADLGNYLPWYRRFDVGMAVYLILVLGGLALVFVCTRDLFRRRWERQLQAVITGRAWITVKEMAGEMQCGQEKVRKILRKLLRKGRFPGAILDAQEGLLILDREVQREYEEAWKEWNQKQSRCQAAGISLERQVQFLEGRRQALALEEQAALLENSRLREKLLHMAQLCANRFSAVEEAGDLVPLGDLRSQYLPKVVQMARKYAEMEQLQEPEELEAVTGEFLELLEKFPLETI